MASLLQAVRTFDLIGGAPVAFATALCTPPTQKPANIPFAIDWAIYFTAAGNAPASLGVNINLQGTTPNASKLDAIRSVKIDNTASFCTIYVWFQDTNDVVTCPPQSVVTMPVNTNNQKCVVIASGLTTGFLPLTNVYFYNVQLPPSVDPAIQLTYPQWIGSPTVQQNASQILTPGYGSPALGDQTLQIQLGLRLAQQTTMFGGPRASGFIYLTGVFISFMQTAGTASGVTTNTFIQSTGSAGILFTIPIFCPNAITVNMTQIFNMPGMNLKLDATQTWQYANSGQNLNINVSTMVLIYTFSVNDR